MHVIGEADDVVAPARSERAAECFGGGVTVVKHAKVRNDPGLHPKPLTLRLWSSTQRCGMIQDPIMPYHAQVEARAAPIPALHALRTDYFEAIPCWLPVASESKKGGRGPPDFKEGRKMTFPQFLGD